MHEKVIDIKNVVFQREGRKILNDVNWEVSHGEHWVIAGLNGSGKTSLLRIITGYQWPTKGLVNVLGNQFGRTNLPELRKSIGWVSASLDEQLLSRNTDTALEVVLSGKYASIGLYEEVTEQDVARAENLLKKLNIHQLADKYYIQLSQGEKRRVVLARALMPDPKILILDEPCNGLDVYAKEQVFATIQTMARQEEGPTLVYVTHQLEEVVPAITHALLLHNGRVIAAGKKKQTLTDTLLSNTFQLPVSVDWKENRPWLRVESDWLREGKQKSR